MISPTASSTVEETRPKNEKLLVLLGRALYLVTSGCRLWYNLVFAWREEKTGAIVC
jgi:hypothetical protein